MMHYISHRGNIEGPDISTENLPSHILKVLQLGYDVEIDLRIREGKLFLGHDYPQYEINENFLDNDGLWIHCKDIESFYFLTGNKSSFHSRNFFWHQNDDVSLTSRGYFFTFPGKKLTDRSISVMPELSVDIDTFDKCCGVCSDYVKNIKEKKYTISEEKLVVYF